MFSQLQVWEEKKTHYCIDCNYLWENNESKNKWQWIAIWGWVIIFLWLLVSEVFFFALLFLWYQLFAWWCSFCGWKRIEEVTIQKQTNQKGSILMATWEKKQVVISDDWYNILD